MTNQPLNWPADQYAIGAFIQHHFSDRVLLNTKFQFKPNDQLLDIGCGDGAYTMQLAKKIPSGKIIGRDPSEKMIRLAQSRVSSTDNIIFECEDAMQLSDSNRYSVITAFWCLQWVPDINQALTNIFRALQPGGRFLAVLPSARCLYIALFDMVKNSGRFPYLHNFVVPVTFWTPDACKKQAKFLGFRAFQAKHYRIKLKIPSLDIIEKFMNGIPFFQGQVPDQDIPALNAAMVEAFQTLCDEKWGGEYYVEDELTVLTGSKKYQIELTPEQRSEIMAEQNTRADLIEPASQRPKSANEHGGSSLKVRPDLANQPQGIAPNLNVNPMANPEAARNEKALTAAPTHQLSNQLKAGMAAQHSKKLTPNG